MHDFRRIVGRVVEDLKLEEFVGPCSEAVGSPDVMFQAIDLADLAILLAGIELINGRPLTGSGGERVTDEIIEIHCDSREKPIGSEIKQMEAVASAGVEIEVV